MKVIKITKKYKFEDLPKDIQEKIALIKLTSNRCYIKGKGMRDGEFYIICENSSDDMYLSYLADSYETKKKNRMTLSEAAKELGVSIMTLRNWNDEGKINFCYQQDSALPFIDKEDIDKQKKEMSRFISNEGKLEFLKENKKTSLNAVIIGPQNDGWFMGLENSGFHVIDDRYDEDSQIDSDVVCSSLQHLKGFSGIAENHPKIFCIETLSRITSKALERFFEGYDNFVKDYQISTTILKAEFYDVPQKRHKSFILGIRKDLKMSDWPPSPNNYIIPLKTALQNAAKSDGEKYTRQKERILKKVKPGKNWKTLPIEDQILYMGNLHPTKTKRVTRGGMSSIARRLSWDELCPLLPKQIDNKLIDRCHPEETRPLSISEYLLIQSFPDNYDGLLSSSYKQSYRNIASSIPVNLAFHIGKSLIKILENNK
ncbi:DNA cytosine methyltransferase [Nitrosomonadales bacterium]|nr:DNA cytosine methyltransferase [Nitrosomonadales bacterium]